MGGEFPLPHRGDMADFELLSYNTLMAIKFSAVEILDWLVPLRVRALKVRLRCTHEVPYSISMLRGVWGRALHELDRETYDVVFEGKGATNQLSPLYIIRPNLQYRRKNDQEIVYEWIVWNDAATKRFDRLCEAWEHAGTMGLGEKEKRAKFVVEEISPLYGNDVRARSLADFLDVHEIPSGPCRLTFPHPLRLMRHGRFLKNPTFPDLVEAAFYRLAPLLHSGVGSVRPRDCWPPFAEPLVALSTMVPSRPWCGEKTVFERYSARQEREVRQESVIGSLDLPQGPGSFLPLLSAVTLLHLGKGTVMGLGRLVVEPLD